MRIASPSCGGSFDLDGKRTRLAALETEMTAPGFWDAPERAQGLVQEMKLLKAWVDPYDKLFGRVQSALELDEMLELEPDPEMIADVERETAALRDEVEAF